MVHHLDFRGTKGDVGWVKMDICTSRLIMFCLEALKQNWGQREKMKSIFF